MKRLTVVLLSLLISAAAISARAQVTSDASGHRLKIYAGAEGSMFQPDYAGNGFAQTSPNRLYGIGAYADFDFSRWITVETEGRWEQFNQCYNPCGNTGNSENTYMIGPRVPIIDYKHLIPYGKFLIGLGNGSFLTGNTTAFAYGGGVDYHIGRSKFMLRIIDFEYQDWRISPAPLYPYGGSVGLSYRVF